MTNFTARNLHQKCVYWGNATPDGYGGFAYDDPVELNCRWEDITLVEELALETQMQPRSEVFLDQDVTEQGMLLLGELVDLDSDMYDSPAIANANIIIRFDKIPNMRGDSFLRKAYVGRLWTGKG